MIVNKSDRKANFLNVDLEIEGRRKLDPLAAEWGERVAVMHCGPVANKRYQLSLEIPGGSFDYSGPDPLIHAFCDLIEKLSPAGRKIWDGAKKEFNAGYELEADELSSEFSLLPATLQRMANLGVGLGVTYYNRAAYKKRSRPA